MTERSQQHLAGPFDDMGACATGPYSANRFLPDPDPPFFDRAFIMGHSSFAGLFLSVLTLGQPAAGEADYYPPIVATARDLQNQIDFMVRALATIPGPPMGRGLSRQTNRIVIDLTSFRDQIIQKPSRDTLYLAFTPVDQELNQLLAELQTIGKWDPAIRLAARRTQSALNDVHLALSAGDVSATRRPLVESRQVQTLLNREVDLQSLAGLLMDPDTLKAWNTDFAELRKSLTELQRLQNKKAGRDDLKQHLVLAEKNWEKLVTRFKALPADQVLPLREDFGQVDQVFSRLSSMFGIQGRRAPLRINFLQ